MLNNQKKSNKNMNIPLDLMEFLDPSNKLLKKKKSSIA